MAVAMLLLPKSKLSRKSHIIKFGNHFKTASLSFYILPRPVMSIGSLLSVMSSDRRKSRHLFHKERKGTQFPAKELQISYILRTRATIPINSEKYSIYVAKRRCDRKSFCETAGCERIICFLCGATTFPSPVMPSLLPPSCPPRSGIFRIRPLM